MRSVFAFMMCALLSSCVCADYKAEQEIEKLQKKLDKISKLTDEAKSELSEMENKDGDDLEHAVFYVGEILDNMENECKYDDYDFEMYKGD